MTKKNAKVITNQIRIIRDIFGFSRMDVALKMNTSVRTVERIESENDKDKRKVRIGEAGQLALIYHVSLNDILLASENKLDEEKIAEIKVKVKS